MRVLGEAGSRLEALRCEVLADEIEEVAEAELCYCLSPALLDPVWRLIAVKNHRRRLRPGATAV